MLNYYIDMAEKQAIFTLIGGRVKIFRGRYNPTSDAVWLAAFIPTRNIKTMLDVGIGTGGVALCATTHNPTLSVTGIDTSNEMLDECAQNAKLNNRDIKLINSDITNWRTAQTFDVVATNPPYFRGTPAKHNAHHNADLTLWTRKSIARVRPNGYFCTIVSADRMAEVISETTRHCGNIEIFPLFGAKHTAERVLIRAQLNAHGGTTLYSGLSMNYEPVLRDGLTIDATLANL